MDGRRRSPRTAPRTGTRLYPGEKGAAGRVPARGAPGADPGAPGEVGGASGSTAAGADPTGQDPTPRVPSPRGTALPVALPDRASDALVGLVRSEEAPGPDRARRRRVARGRGGGKGRRQTPPPPRPVPSPAWRPAPLLRAPAPPRRDSGHRGALRPRGWRQGGAGRRPKGTGVRMGGGKGPPGAGVRKRGPSAVPAKSGPFPVLGCCSSWTPAHLAACCTLPHFLATWSVCYRAWDTLLTTHSALGGVALGGCRVLPPGVPFPSPPCSEPAGCGLVLCSGTRSSVTQGSQCVSCTGVPATQR